jgi:hypothetical protein
MTPFLPNRQKSKRTKRDNNRAKLVEIKEVDRITFETVSASEAMAGGGKMR